MGIVKGVAMVKGIFLMIRLRGIEDASKISKNIAKLDPFLNRKRGVG